MFIHIVSVVGDSERSERHQISHSKVHQSERKLTPLYHLSFLYRFGCESVHTTFRLCLIKIGSSPRRVCRDREVL